MYKAFLLVALLWSTASPSSDIAGFWTGTASRGGETRIVHLRVENSADGLRASYDIPSIGLEGIPLPEFRFDPQSGTYSAGHQISVRPLGEQLAGTISPLLGHGQPAEIILSRGRPSAPVASERPVEFTSRGELLRGTLVAPPAPGRYPAMVSLHGSGPSTRWFALGRARRFAEAGYVTLIFDKPGTGESQGDWTSMSLDDAASDALSAMRFLRRQPEVNPEQVGLWGHSQAGWTISRAAAMADETGFAIVLAGGGVSPQEVERFGYRNRLAHAGASEADVERAMALVDGYFDYLRSGVGYEEIRAAVRAAADQPWARALGLSRVIPAPADREKWAWVATYQPAADIRRIRFPVLVLFAEQDRSSPLEGLSIWETNLRAGSNARFETHVIPQADHHFMIADEAAGWPTIVPGYYEMQFRWLDRIVRS